MSKKYPVLVEVEIDEDGIFVVSCAIFMACHADGATIDEALVKLREVVEMCLED